MVNVLLFYGDTRQIIADKVSDEYEGSLHNFLFEYFDKVNITLCYFFNKEYSVHKLLFKNNEDWLLNNSRRLKGAEKPLLDITTTNYFLNLNDVINITGEQYDFYISNYLSNTGQMLFQKVESLLEYRTIIKGKRRIKKYGIRMDEGMWSGPVDFDTLEELKEILSREHRAKQLVPISYTPWDSKEIEISKSCKVEDITLLYLYENQVFEKRTY